MCECRTSEFRQTHPARTYRCDNTRPNERLAANAFAVPLSPYPTSSGLHNRVDEHRGSSFVIGSLDCPQPALLAFGGDSAIELISAALLLWRFRGHEIPESAEQRVNRVAGGLLFLLAAYAVAVAALSLLGHREPKPSYVGIAVLIVAAIAMPWLARQKRKLAAETGSAALRADAAGVPDNTHAMRNLRRDIQTSARAVT